MHKEDSINWSKLPRREMILGIPKKTSEMNKLHVSWRVEPKCLLQNFEVRCTPGRG